jgi:hypothetical protein
LGELRGAQLSQKPVRRIHINQNGYGDTKTCPVRAAILILKLIADFARPSGAQNPQ